jgi:insertion element IS1 protein InsB
MKSAAFRFAGLRHIRRYYSLVHLDLKARLAPFGIIRYFTDGWGAYQHHLDPGQREIGKRNTQKLKRKHLTLCTRIS